MSTLFLKEILRPTKIQILHAPDGITAIDMVTNNADIDLILMDIKLPGISGYEATKRIKEIMDIPVIAQTAYAMTDDPSKILEAGCDDYISKPIHRKNLLARIAFYLTKKSGPKAD
jgi:CheY-like chemotaxis protein